MIVEGECIDPSLRQPAKDLFLGGDVECFMPQVKARIRAKPRPQPFDAVQQGPGVVGAPQPGFPRPSHAMKNRGDAVSDGLAVAFEHGDVDCETHARPRHHLPFEGVTVDIDNTRQNEETVGVEGRSGARRAAEIANHAVDGIEIDGRVFQAVADKRQAALQTNVRAVRGRLPASCRAN